MMIFHINSGSFSATPVAAETGAFSPAGNAPDPAGQSIGESRPASETTICQFCES
jgi:hypothetical protein